MRRILTASQTTLSARRILRAADAVHGSDAIYPYTPEHLDDHGAVARVSEGTRGGHPVAHDETEPERPGPT